MVRRVCEGNSRNWVGGGQVCCVSAELDCTFAPGQKAGRKRARPAHLPTGAVSLLGGGNAFKYEPPVDCPGTDDPAAETLQNGRFVPGNDTRRVERRRCGTVQTTAGVHVVLVAEGAAWSKQTVTTAVFRMIKDGIWSGKTMDSWARPASHH
jgi:hypothetical protein